MLYLHAITPIHTGTGQSVGTIDLPVARETVTNWPVLPGSGIKGELRDACRDAGTVNAILKEVFGPDAGAGEQASEHAGGVWFPDAHLLCLPVRSLKGSFAWVTCPLALERWQRDHLAAGLPFPLSVPTVAPPGDGPVPILLGATGAANLAIGTTVYLEDLDLTVDPGQATAVDAIAGRISGACFPDPAWQTRFHGHFGVVPDDVFGFLAVTATEVAARVRIDQERKTVADGQLWYEEAVPAEAIFAAPLLAAPQGKRRMAAINGTAADQGEAALFQVIADAVKSPIQLGGKASVGRGLAWARLVEAAP